MVARLMVGEKNLAAGRDPFDRPADAPGRPQHQYMFGINEILGAEATADIGCDEPDGSRPHAQRTSGIVARGMDALARNIRRIPAALGVIEADDATGFYRVGDDAVIVEC